MENLNTFIKNSVITMPARLNDYLYDSGKKFKHRSDYEIICSHIDTFLDGKKSDRFLVLPGLRGVGKSTLLYQIYEYLLKQKDISSNDILMLSGENLKIMFDCSLMDAIKCYLKDFHKTEIIRSKKPLFLLIDEAQYDENWSMTGKIIYDSSKNIFMIFTGSSALELEYNADSARRLIKIPISPLTYPQHLKLKYNYNIESKNSIINLIFEDKIDDAIEFEDNLLDEYAHIENYDIGEWDYYMEYGGFPFSFNEEEIKTVNKLIDVIDRIIYIDMKNLKDVSYNTQNATYKLLYFLSLQSPGDVSLNSLSKYLEIPVKSTKNIIDTLEKTQLLFHVEPYSSSPKRGNKPFKYFFATPSLRNILSLKLGIASTNYNSYKGILLENFVASSFNNLNKNDLIMYNMYYDSNIKSNVDFLVQRGFDNPIPVEVSAGKKNRRQVKNAINRYESSHGIIISDTTEQIVQDNDIIYLPIKTFSFM